MSDLLAAALRSAEWPVLLSAFLPLVVAVFLWARFYQTYDVKGLRPVAEALTKAADAGAMLATCDRAHAAKLEAAMGSDIPPAVWVPWARLKEDSKKEYTEGFLPEAAAYYSFEATVAGPGGRRHITTLWGMFGMLCIASLALPVLASLFTSGESLAVALVWGVLGLAALCIVQGIFALADHNVYQTAASAFERFTATFNRVLPVASPLAGAALLVSATRASKEAFAEAADRITARFDGFSDEVVLPALKASAELMIEQTLTPAIQRIEATLGQAMELFSQRHEREMKTITDAFATKLAGTLELRINALGDMLQTVEDGIQATNKQLGANLAGMDALLTEQKSTLQQALDLVAKSSEIQKAGNDNYEFLNVKVNALTDSIVRFEEDTAGFQATMANFLEGFQGAEENLGANVAELRSQYENLAKLVTGMLDDLTARMNESMDGAGRTIAEGIAAMSAEFRAAEDNMGTSVAELREQYMGLGHMVRDMMDNITGRMNEAMAGAGREIAHGIQGATADNAQAIADLTEQAAKLREDYDTYFSRLADTTKQTLDDMDYHVQNITAGINEQVGAMLRDLLEKNTFVLEQYKDSTTGLLASFDEQARSMGLYAKEMNFDITELSANLKDSVATFTQEVREGIELTVGDFDKALAELAERLAITVEGISDAVESLPAAIKAGGGR